MTNKIRNTSAEADANPMSAILTGLPGGIEASEARGQRELVASEVLPTDLGAFFDGGRGSAKNLLESWGFTFGEPVEGDPLFQHATLPPGWKKEATDHSMWSRIVDEKGRERCAIFYKAAFYDRRASLSIRARYRIERLHDGKSALGVPVRGAVFEGERVLFEGPVRTPSTVDSERFDAFEQAAVDAQDWFKANLPFGIAEQWALP
jgi:hypothetical protein